MKTFSFLSLISIISFFSFSACQSKPTDVASKASTKSTPQVVEEKDVISNETFALWTENWQRNQKTWMADPNNSINYFAMPRVDLGEVLMEKPVGTRFYLGLDIKNQPNVIHLMVVGTDSLGQIMLNESCHAYDVTAACPPMCNEQNQAKMKK